MFIFDNSDNISAARELCSETTNFISNASNISALIFSSLGRLNWAGFYLFTGKELLLGPFQGKPACIRISLGKGVCGTAAARKETVIVDNVHTFEGHIACDSASNSEIVIPLLFQDRLIGVIDLDSPDFSRFNESDKLLLEELANILVSSSDIENLLHYFSY